MSFEKNSQEAGNISRFLLQSNKKSGKVIDISNGVMEFRYYESILSNTVSATATILETGYSTNQKGKTRTKGTILDQLPVRGGERAIIKIEDAYGTELDLPLYVNRVRDVDPGTQKDIYFLDFSPKEHFANEQTRVVQRYTGKIHNHVSSIMSDVLKTRDPVEIDSTALDYNFIGNDRKPLYVITWLASKAVPNNAGLGKGNSIGGAAGYLFYQTHDGFQFRSIDKLFKGKVKAKYIYNNTTDAKKKLGDTGTKRYKDKILKYTIKSDVDLQQNLTLGTYNNRSIFFDFYSMNYKVVNYSIDQQDGKIYNAGERFAPDLIAKEFTASPTRLMSHVLDVGVLPKGKSAKKQLENDKASNHEANFDAENTMVQSIMRYNQMFSIQINITVPGNFELRAGDRVQCDFPGLDPQESISPNTATRGIYIIAHLCHKITPRETYTSLGLVRDSFNDR